MPKLETGASEAEPQPHQMLLIFSTCPDQQTADHIAETLISERLAACVNILPGATSVYEWKGKIERDQEWVLLIKSRRACFARLQQRLIELHPYELPEVIGVPVTEGLSGYLEWVERCTPCAD